MLLFSDSSENNRESFWVKDTDPSRKGRKAERTAGSNADAGYKLARSFRCISLIEFKAQFHRVSLVRHDAQQLVKWSIRVVKVSLYLRQSRKELLLTLTTYPYLRTLSEKMLSG